MDNMSNHSGSMVASTVPSEPGGHGGPDALNLLSQNATDQETKRKVSMTYATDNEGRPVGIPLDLFLFSDTIRRPPLNGQTHPVNEFSAQHPQPDTRQFPQYEVGKLPGYVPLSDEFHKESNRERIGPDDDGLDEEDLTAADGIYRKKKPANVKRRTIIYENIHFAKGEFIFPYKTYRPKAQVAFSVPTGVPQAVVAERLHRLYKRTDINLVLQSLGVEISDLIPPPNYGEGNERFYQEMMFRNRTKVNGIDKAEFILYGGRKSQYRETSVQHLHAPRSNISSSDTDDLGSVISTSSRLSETEEEVDPPLDLPDGDDEEEEEEEGSGKQSQPELHPFIKNKPPFGSMFPIHCFDNGEYDIRTPEEWMSLGWDSKEVKFYPLPGKAFIPLPGNEAKQNSKALSETVIDHLLTNTPRLEKFYHWLLMERFRRNSSNHSKLDNVVDSKFIPTDVELSILARGGTTVQSLFRESHSDVLVKITKIVESRVDAALALEATRLSLATTYANLHEFAGESSESYDSHRKNSQEEEVLNLSNVVYKKWEERKPDEDDLIDDDSDEKENTNLEGALKKDKPGTKDPAAAIKDRGAKRDPGDEFEETEAEDIDEDPEGRDYNFIPGAGFQGQGGHGRPSSPDIDAYMDGGFDRYILDYDKMKKVHIYDWRWVDVAVFDYNPETERYYVRTIYPPLIHAWLDKIYLIFDGEDPTKHGQRIWDAVLRRSEMEQGMRYNLYLDCLPVEEMYSMDEETMEIIVRKCLQTPRIKFTDDILTKIIQEVELEFKRVLAKTKFEHIIDRHPRMYQPWVTKDDLKEAADGPTSSAGLGPTNAILYREPIENLLPEGTFDYRVKKLKKLSVIYEKYPYEAFRRINEICLEAKSKKLVIVDDLEALHIDEWERKQKENMMEVRAYLEDIWYEEILQVLKDNLGKIPKSWYNLKETRYDVFSISKLANYIQMLQFFMENTLRALVMESLVSFSQRIEKVCSECDLTKLFQWGDEDDLKTSVYPTPLGVSQIWILELYMDHHGPKYTQMLGTFLRVASELFTEVIGAVKGLPSLLPQIMPQMHYATVSCLRTPETDEPELQIMKSQLLKYIKRSILPLDTYVQMFRKYQDIWNLDVPSYIKDWETESHTADDLSEAVEEHQAHQKQLEDAIPTEINITGFRVVVDVVREGLIKKKKLLYNSLLDNYAQKLKKIIFKVREDYAEIEKKLNTRSDYIEEVLELRAFEDSVPKLVEELESITAQVIKNYDVFDRFMYVIPNDDINAKWQAADSGTKILKMIKKSNKALEEDHDRLLKVQQSDLAALNDQIDSAIASVGSLVGYIQIEKAADVAQEVKRMWKTVHDLVEHSEMLNERQLIFGYPPLVNEALGRLTDEIEPFKDLWTTAADLLRLSDTVFNGTLEKIDLEALYKMVSEGSDLMEGCVEYFLESDQIQQIASILLQQITDLKPIVPLLKTLKSQGMRQRHWERISEICGFPVIAKGAQNFKKLQELGIQAHTDEVVEVGELANKEFAIEQALDRMEKGIAPYQVKLEFDPVTNQMGISLLDSVLDIVIQYISETNEILFNPLNKAFEERLMLWDRKIKGARDCIEVWLQNQDQWQEIEPMFRPPDVPTRLPVEFKMFEKLRRIWRRLIRLARNTPSLIELAADSTVLNSLHQFEDLIFKINQALDELKKPKGSDEDSDD